MDTERLDEQGRALYEFTLKERLEHREEFVEYVEGYLMLMLDIYNFREHRVYDLYDAFEEKVADGIKDGDVVVVKELEEKIGELIVNGDKVTVKLSTSEGWAEVKVDLDMLKFTDWSLYT